MKSTVILPALVPLFCAAIALGQSPTKNLAIPGPTGVYVNLGLGFPSAAKPFRGITAYRVERRAGKENNWHRVADVGAPASLEELRIRIAQAMQLVPEPLRVDSLPTEWIWQRMKLGPDSLRLYASLLPVRLALGIIYLDTLAPRATPIEYKVSGIDIQGKAMTSFVSKPVFFPAVLSFAKLKAKKSTASENRVRIQWSSPADSPTRMVRAYRREDLAGSFSPISTHASLTREKDSLVLDMIDVPVQRDRIYEYYVIPMDPYGNTGLPSDTVRLPTYNFTLASTATYAKAESMDSLGGLRIRWQLQSPSLVQSITLYRSETLDTGYTAIAHLPSSTGEFLDQATVPMKDYYYYVEASGPLGERTRASATVHGLYQSSLLPFPPVHVQAEPAMEGITVTWTSAEEGISGYYVYRGNAGASSLDQVSPFIPARGTGGSFTDSGQTLSPRYTYAYAVRSENSSHRMSPFSDTVYARPGIRTSPRPPLGLRGNAEAGTIQLVWEDMYSAEPSLLGFKVLRRQTGETTRGQTEFKELTASLLPAVANHFADTTAVKGQVYEYAVESFDAFGGKSGLSNFVRVSVDAGALLPPTGLRASVQRDGILLEWDEASGASLSGYRLYRYIRGEPPVRIATLKAPESHFTDTKAQKGQLYFYYATSTSQRNVESGPSEETGVRR